MLQGAENTAALGKSAALTSTEVLLKPEFFLFPDSILHKNRRNPIEPSE